MTDFDLNDVQRRAVEAVEKPVLIFAGAGTGKTRVLTHKVAHLVRNAGYKPENILAVTFTNKAAQEMNNRVAGLLGLESTKVRIGTFHSVCARLLREEIVRLGGVRDFVIYDVDDQVSLIKTIMKDLDVSRDGISPQAIQSRISLLKNRMEDPRDVARNGKSPLEEAVGEIYPAYEKNLNSNHALDFDDLLLYPLRLFEEFPMVLEAYQDRFRYVLVDEYQDTNHPQFLFIRKLTEGHRNVSVVGDDDQSIYGWRGADVANILEFESAFPDCEVFKLEENYRSTQAILTAASSVVGNNQYRSEKKLWTRQDEGENIGLMSTHDEEEEAEGILELMEKEILHRKRAFRDFVILYRTNAQSRALEEGLRRRGIAYTIVGGIKFYDRKEVKDLLAYLRLVINPLDTVSLKRVINFPPRGIGTKTIEKCEAWAAQTSKPLFDVLESPDAMGLKGKQAAGLVEFYQTVLKYQQLRDSLDASELASVLVDELGLVNFYKDQGTAEARERLENVQELINSIDDFCSRHEGAGIREFLEEVSLLADIDTWDDESNSVTLMTLHSAKGLEFPVVFISGLEEGLFPLARSLDDPRELEEERRLFYVGLTRAKEKVYLHYATDRRRFLGVPAYGMVSRFVHEIPENLIDAITFRSAVTKRYVKDEQTERYSLREVRTVTSFDDLKRGDKVQHSIFGKGLVTGVDGAGENQKISVRFQGNVQKKLIAKYANLQRL